MPTDAKVMLWGTMIGAVSWVEDRQRAVFQYSPEFLRSGIQPSPITMPLREEPYEFPALNKESFMGLPGLLADSLPDKYGNALLDAWLASQGRTRQSFHPVERLCYMGKRGMGALEFEPAAKEIPSADESLEISHLVTLANQILNQRQNLSGMLSSHMDNNQSKDQKKNSTRDQRALEGILRVGTSAGGARAKAIIDWDPATGKFRSGQTGNPGNYEHWMIKFDGITNNRDRELADPQGYGKIEYAYSLMAKASGIEMMPCRLHHEGGRAHFMTRRFDRTPKGEKLHMQTLGCLAHFDYNQAGSYAYEQCLQIMLQLNLPRSQQEQLVLRAFFNIMARNQDDHVKNISFLMNRRGEWSLAPAYDVTYAWDPEGQWTTRHQMSMNGKRDGFGLDDLLAFAALAGIKSGTAMKMVNRIGNTLKEWAGFARETGISKDIQKKIKETFRYFKR